MKTYILMPFIIILPSLIHAQCKFEKNEVDEFTGKINKQTKWTRIAPKNVMAVIAQIDKTIGILIAGDLGCVDDDSKAYFKFQDGTILELHHAGKIDCGQLVSLILPLIDNLSDFASKPIDKIRLVGSENTVDVSLNDPNYFVNVLNNCFNINELQAP